MRRKVLLGSLLTLLAFQPISAKDFFFGFTSHGSNFWLGNLMQTPVYLLNECLLGGGATSIGMDWISVSSTDDSNIRMQNGNYFGFKARDMFNNFGYGAQVTYMPQYSWFGIWVEGGYKYRQFRMSLDMPEQETNKYKLNAWYAGGGIRLTIKPMLEEHEWAPFIEYGTRYNAVFSPKAPFDSSTDQFGKGISMRLGIGARILLEDEQSLNLSVSYSLPQYDYFNRDFETSTGFKPYENIKARNHSIFINIQTEF